MNSKTHILIISFFIVIFSQPLSAQIDRKPIHYLRTKIQTPADYAYSAHARGLETAADICAGTLAKLEQTIRMSPLDSLCEDRPNLSYLAAGKPLDDDLEFLSLSIGRFLIKVRCQSGAYNATYMFFPYDEASITPVFLTDSSYDKRPALPLLVFPTPKNNSAFADEYSPLLFARDFDLRNFTLFTLSKMTGDGSGGYYAEYKIDTLSFIPALQLVIYKNEPDHNDGYNFERGQKPHGKDWIEYKPKVPMKGCFMDVTDLNLGSGFGKVKCK
jgi:hypothetical protein